MTTERTLLLVNRRRAATLILLVVLVGVLLAIKSINDNWFEPQTPLELNGQPALVFFTLGKGCECQMKVIRNAEEQLAIWQVLVDNQLLIFTVDFSRRPDLAKQYNVARAPALVLLDAAGEVAWKQDLGLSDEAPLDLETADLQIESILRLPLR